MKIFETDSQDFADGRRMVELSQRVRSRPFSCLWRLVRASSWLVCISKVGLLELAALVMTLHDACG